MIFSRIFYNSLLLLGFSVPGAFKEAFTTVARDYKGETPFMLLPASGSGLSIPRPLQKLQETERFIDSTITPRGAIPVSPDVFVGRHKELNDILENFRGNRLIIIRGT